jgi:two-component system, response regulator
MDKLGKAHLILLVEDNPDDEALALRALRKTHASVRVEVARDGVEALEFLSGGGRFGGRHSRDLPDLVLLDMKLPKLSGLEVLRRVRADARTRFLPVVMLTSSVEESDLISSYGSGVNSYVRKPVSFDDFTEAVRQLGLYWLVINEPPPKVIAAA